MRLRGILAPLTTPFDHKGEIYWSKLEYNVSQLLRTKVSGFLVTDRWGEGPLLSSDEKVSIWRQVATQTGSKAAVLATVSGCGVKEARRLVGSAAEAGCAAVVLEAPSIKRLSPNTPTVELFFRAVADDAGLPILVGLNTGEPDGCHPSQLESLRAHPAIAGAVVEDFGEDEFAAASRLASPGFAVVSRDLSSIAARLRDGASAAVLAVAAAVPFHALSIEEAVRTRELEAAADLIRRALDLDRLLSEHGVPALKHALDQRSFYGGVPRLPLLRLPIDRARAVTRSLAELAS